MIMEQIVYFVSHYGYLAIFLLLAPGIFGIPLPDELLLTFVGYLALRGDLHLLPVVAVVIVGSIFGLTVDYWVGRAITAGLIRQSGGWLRLRSDRFEGLKTQLHQRGGWVLFWGNFFPGIRHWLTIAAGITTFPLAGFCLFAYAGVLAWSGFYILLGYFLGQEAGLWVERISAHGHIASGVIVFLLLGYFLIGGRLRQKWPGKRCKPIIP